jgi:signal transduction histidine kinase
LIRTGSSGRSADDFHSIVSQILLLANRGTPLVTFLEEATQILLDASRGGAVVVRLEEWTPAIRCRAIRATGAPFRFETARTEGGDSPPGFSAGEGKSPQAILCRFLLREEPRPSKPSLTARGSYWSPDAQKTEAIRIGALEVAIDSWARAGSFRSLALIPFRVGERPCGIVQIIAERAGIFDDSDVLFLEDVAETLGLALTHHRVQWAFQERVKELTCLYGIAKIAERRDLSIPEVLAKIVHILPPGWQYPSECAARIALDGESYATEGFVDGAQPQTADITIGGIARGRVEVVYTKTMPEMHEGPFLAEERSLINEVARQVAILIERRRAEEEKGQLEQQLLHTERLATIGKLTAGIAHELNEPLGSILGFAQIVHETAGLPEQAIRDVDRILKAAIHAREIIKKLMFFGRQTPPGKVRVNLNDIVEDGIGFLEPRFAAQQIRYERSLAPALPEVVADPGQMRQVLVNLTVNATQAMPDGGTLRLSTAAEEGWIILTVEDTGMGMPEEVLRQVFVPFFTTKDVGQGTGLGLAVVHGIVAAHGGRIDVESEVGKGTRFRVRLPVAGINGSESEAADSAGAKE